MNLTENPLASKAGQNHDLRKAPISFVNLQSSSIPRVVPLASYKPILTVESLKFFATNVRLGREWLTDRSIHHITR